MIDQPLIKVGVITSAHGVRGQVKILPFTDSPEDILTYSPLSDASGKRRFAFTRQGIKDRQLIVSIDGVADRNAAELLKGTELFAVAHAPTQSKENTWGYGELTGLQARLGDGKPYGKVIGVYNFGAGDIVEIELPSGKTEMLPFKKDFVGEVKPGEGYLIVIPADYTE